jgi:hypothetical protein
VAVFETRDLAIYASIIATLEGSWSLYHGLIRDRPRIIVKPYRAESIPAGVLGARQDIFMVKVSNRGRRPVTIDHVGYVAKAIRGTHALSMDLLRQLTEPKRLEESESLTLIHGEAGGYSHGDLPTKRWFAQDGAQRIHPLRERYRQRVEQCVYWPLRRFLDWRDRRNHDEGEDDEFIDV